MQYYLRKAKIDIHWVEITREERGDLLLVRCRRTSLKAAYLYVNCISFPVGRDGRGGHTPVILGKWGKLSVDVVHILAGRAAKPRGG